MKVKLSSEDLEIINEFFTDYPMYAVGDYVRKAGTGGVGKVVEVTPSECRFTYTLQYAGGIRTTAQEPEIIKEQK